MKRKLAIALAVALLSCIAASASAAVPYTAVLENTYGSIISDTTSRAGCLFGRLYITSNSSNMYCHFYLTYNGEQVTNVYNDKLTAGRWMYYNEYIPKDAIITLNGRCDSSISSATITGSFGAGCAANGGW